MGTWNSQVGMGSSAIGSLSRRKDRTNIDDKQKAGKKEGWGGRGFLVSVQHATQIAS